MSINLEVESAVEALMDKHGADKVLAAVAEVLKLKAAHVEDNWQDQRMADRFYIASSMACKAASKVSP